MSDEPTGQKTRSILLIILLICSSFLVIFSPVQMFPNADALSFWKQDSHDDFVNGTMVNLTIEGLGPDAELKLDLKGQWTNLSPPQSPIPRVYFGMAYIHGTDKILIYGGLNDTESFNDTWIYDYGDNTWTEMFPANSPNVRDRMRLAPILAPKKCYSLAVPWAQLIMMKPGSMILILIIG